MNEKQFDNFWEVKCPKCGTYIDLEILIQRLSANSDMKIKIKE